MVVCFACFMLDLPYQHSMTGLPSSLSAWRANLSDPPASLLSYMMIYYLCSQRQIFFSLSCWSLDPLVDLSRSPGWGTVLFTAQRALCAENRYSMAGSAREQLAACSLALTHIHTNTNGHMTILAGIRCLPQYNDYTLSVCPCVSSLQTDTACSLPQQQ